VAVGDGHSCALLAGGSIECWGANTVGELGDGKGDTADYVPVAVVGISNAIAVTAGGTHTCAMLSDGSVECWGSNDYGELGDGSQIPLEGPRVRRPFASSASPTQPRSQLALSIHALFCQTVLWSAGARISTASSEMARMRTARAPCAFEASVARSPSRRGTAGVAPCSRTARFAVGVQTPAVSWATALR
jgi:hypothetical protein